MHGNRRKAARTPRSGPLTQPGANPASPTICRHPTLRGPSYDLIHCTLARFAASLPITAREVRAHAAHWQSFSTPLHQLALVCERRYPSLEVEDIAATTFSRN